MKKLSSATRIIILIGFTGALAIFSSTISKSLLSLFSESLGATSAQIGLIASASTIPGILISYIAGDLADRVGITPANLSVLKNDKAKAIRFSTLEALCRELGCQPGDLLSYVPEEDES